MKREIFYDRCKGPIIVDRLGGKIEIMLKIYYDRFWETCHNISKSLIFFFPHFSFSSPLFLQKYHFFLKQSRCSHVLCCRRRFVRRTDRRAVHTPLAYPFFLKQSRCLLVSRCRCHSVRLAVRRTDRHVVHTPFAHRFHLDKFSLFSSLSLHMCVGLWFCFGVSERCFAILMCAAIVILCYQGNEFFKLIPCLRKGITYQCW